MGSNNVDIGGGDAMRLFRMLGVVALLLSVSAMGQRTLAQSAGDIDKACAAAGDLQFPHTRIVQAQAIRPNPEFVVPGTEMNPAERGGPVRVARAFCRVSGIVEPAIRFEVWLPLESWNGRFEGLGLGAFSGAVPYAPMAAALSQGYAVGGTDTGHQSGFADATWTQGKTGLNSEVVADWAHRGIHEMTVKSQAIVQAVYGARARYSYFVGCSSGGHQALTEAQRYPNDYDGILAGAPANYWTHLMAGQLWYGLATRVDPATDLEMPANKLRAIHAAALQACDANDGVQDGVIENPLACKFDPSVLACKDGVASETCLTGPQLGALRKIYADARDSSGRKIFPGLAPGGEQGWKQMSAVQVNFAQTFYRYFVFQNPQWSYATFNLDRDVARADHSIGSLVNSTNADLGAFRAHGGKLLQYHGWNDPLISPYNSIDYYEAVVAKLGATRQREQALRNVQGFHRLFMVPGMTHCRGGDGTDTFDGLGALQRWVEQSVAPESLQASKLADGKTVRTRPLCPYPQVARYRGSGSTDEAANFKCDVP
jgi:feruloyl esterase